MHSEKSNFRLALVVLGDLLREEIPRVKPFLELLGSWDPHLKVHFPQWESRRNPIPLEEWGEKARSRGWDALFIMPFVRSVDLPWLGAGSLKGLPVYFLRNPGIQDVGSHLGELEEFLAKELRFTPPSVESPKSIEYYFQEHCITGEIDILEKIPFLQDYLGRVHVELSHEPQSDDSGLVQQLKAELSEKEHTIRRLIRSEKRYKKFFEDDITGDFVMNLNYRVIDCNRSFARIFGFPSIDYALGYDIRHLFPSRSSRIQTVRSFLQLQYLDYHEMELVRPDGQIVHIIGNMLGIRNEEGQLIQVRGFLFDNTPRKHLEQQLRESQKMEGLGRLAGGVAHDFNNLLTVINGYAELLLGDLDPQSPMALELGEILNAGIRASELTSQLLAFSRRQVLSPRILGLNGVIRGLESMLLRLMSEKIHLKLNLASDIPSIKADKGQLEQVILNLTLNARDAMPSGGQIVMETSKVILDTATYGGDDFLLPGTYVSLTVTDTGIGMDEETQKRIFEPFFTTKTQGKGTGLGLAMVYGIVSQSGGALKVQSKVGVGTTFKVFFDGVLEVAPLPLEGHLVDLPKPVNSGERIILVEDESMVREYALKILTRYGYKVKAFSNGQEALDYVNQTQPLWDLVVTDVVMPQMTGPEFLKELDGLGKPSRVLYLSGYTDDEILRHGIYSNTVSFLHKPFKAKDLLGRVRGVLDGFSESS